MFKRDTDYIVKDDKVVIIDEFTGRMMEGRRWSNGLHQAVEAKEGVKIEPENQTLASITFQNYFRMYPKLSGMTGTAATEAAEFWDIYKLNVAEIPTHKPVARIDEDDQFYKNTMDKFQAIAKAIREKNDIGQPVLVGTVSIEKSELLSAFLEQEGVEHEVLNARQHEREAHIVAQAGRIGCGDHRHQHGRPRHRHPAGRQSSNSAIEDELGDMPEGAESDAEEDRIKQEARGRGEPRARGGRSVRARHRTPRKPPYRQPAARPFGPPGRPGPERFYLCLEDDLLRIFGPDTLFSKMMNSNLEDGEAIGSKWLSKAIETAQKKVEARNYEIRKQVVQYDDVMNDQRKVIYEQRAEIMDSESGRRGGGRHASRRDQFAGRRSLPARLLSRAVGDRRAEGARSTKCSARTSRSMHWLEEDTVEPEIIEERLRQRPTSEMDAKMAASDPALWRRIEKSVLLQKLDGQWKEHLATLDALAPGGGSARACAEAADQRVQAGGLRPVRASARHAARGRDHQADEARCARAGADAAESLPDLPDFLTGHIDPLTGLDNSNDGDGSAVARRYSARWRAALGGRLGRAALRATIPMRAWKSAAMRRAPAVRATSTSIATGRSAPDRRSDRTVAPPVAKYQLVCWTGAVDDHGPRSFISRHRPRFGWGLHLWPH